MDKEKELEDIELEIRTRTFWRNFDLVCYHLISWGVIVGCLLSIYVLYKENLQWSMISVMISTFLIICDKTFNFGTRSEWGKNYIAELELIKNDLEHDIVKVVEARKKRIELRKNNPLSLIHK